MDLRDFFHRRCSEMLVMEREVWQLTSVMAQESWQAELKRYFERHTEPKRQQISHLEQIVDELGGIIGSLEHPVLQSVRRLHRQFMELTPPPALIEINNALEAEKLTHLGIATYHGLVLLARELGEEEAARRLEQNLHAEEEMRDSLERLVPGLISDFGDQLHQAA